MQSASGPPAIPILHITTGLTVGGAENILAELTARLDRSRFQSSVVSLTEKGPMAARIQAAGIEVDALEMRSLGNRLPGFLKLRRIIRSRRPAIIQTWLYHADMIGTISAIGSGAKLVWNLRQSNLHPKSSKLSTRLTARACVPLSRLFPHKIICGSQSAYDVHAKMGYDAKKMAVITNGVDLSRFKPRNSARASVRSELQISSDTKLVGLIGRFDSQKNHAAFIRAASAIAKTNCNVEFLLCGAGVDKNNHQLNTWIEGTNAAKRFHLLGVRNDIETVTAALDLSVSSSSYGEGFSNTMVEALASGVPCVSTDIGDVRQIVGDCGLVVPPMDDEALKAAILKMLLRTSGNTRMERAARARAEANFDIESMVRHYEATYDELVTT